MAPLARLQADLARRLPSRETELDPLEVADEEEAQILWFRDLMLVAAWHPGEGIEVATRDDYEKGLDVVGAFDRIIRIVEGPGERHRAPDDLAAEAQDLGFYPTEEP